MLYLEQFLSPTTDTFFYLEELQTKKHRFLQRTEAPSWQIKARLRPLRFGSSFVSRSRMQRPTVVDISNSGAKSAKVYLFVSTPSVVSSVIQENCHVQCLAATSVVPDSGMVKNVTYPRSKWRVF